MVKKVKRTKLVTVPCRRHLGSDVAGLFANERQQCLASVLRPSVSQRRTNVHQVALLSRPRDLHVLACDWTQKVGAQPLTVAVVGQMQLHAYS